MLWYQRFPEFKTNKLFLSGESYAGIYIPYLAWQIYQHNKQAEFDTTLTKVNFEGFMVGNACADWDFDSDQVETETFYRFHLIPQKLWNKYNDLDCAPQFADVNSHNSSVDPDACNALQDHIWDDLIGNLNPYDLFRYQYADANGVKMMTEEERWTSTMVGGQEKKYRQGITYKERAIRKNRPTKVGAKQAVSNDFVTNYINNASLRTDLHIPEGFPAWEECSDPVYDLYHKQTESSLWIYPIFK